MAQSLSQWPNHQQQQQQQQQQRQRRRRRQQLQQRSSWRIHGHNGVHDELLTPSLLRAAGLRVLHASLPSSRAGGLETDYGHFHMWVLELTGE